MTDMSYRDVNIWTCGRCGHAVDVGTDDLAGDENTVRQRMAHDCKPANPHHEHWVGIGEDGSPECCICAATPCSAATVADVMLHRDYDRECGFRSGEWTTRDLISRAIAEAAGMPWARYPVGHPKPADDDPVASAYYACFDIARESIDEPPF
jgi:hypothetical protein